MVKYNDKQLLEGIIARDEKVNKYILYELKPAILLYLTNKGCTIEDAEDLFQDGLVRLFEMVERENFELTCKLSVLLNAICTNKHKEQLEKKKAAKNYTIRKPQENEFYEMEIMHDKNIKNEIYESGFKKLKKDCQIIIRALHKGVPTKELAFTLDYNYDYLRRKKRLCHDYLIYYARMHKDYKVIEKLEGEVKFY